MQQACGNPDARGPHLPVHVVRKLSVKVRIDSPGLVDKQVPPFLGTPSPSFSRHPLSELIYGRNQSRDDLCPPGHGPSQPRSPYSGQLVQKVEGVGISAGSTGHQQRGPGPPMPRH